MGRLTRAATLAATVIAACVGLVPVAAADTTTLTATVRDFAGQGQATALPSQIHPDFETYCCFQLNGMVAPTLDADGKPVAAGWAGTAYQSPASFATWYRDTSYNQVPGSSPASYYTFSIPLTLTSDASGVYHYSSGAFFPIDGLGFGNYALGHNFHFTSEIHTKFTWVDQSPALVFGFCGDDDVWVFVNGHLGVDIGGVHGPVCKSITLDAATAAALGMVDHGTYSLDIFQAERHTSGSNFNISTTLELKPARPAPVVTAADATVEGNTLGGSNSWPTPTAVDADGVSLPVTCDPAAGSLLPLGANSITCTATDSTGLEGQATYTVTVVDTTKPALVAPANVTVEATGPSTFVALGNGSATDIVWGTITPNCPASGSFPLGTTTLFCSATDGSGNTSGATYTVTVVDTTAPAVIVPGTITVDPGTPVTFSASANDLVDGSLPTTCSPASGSTFPVGTTTVTCSATDSSGNTGTASFTVRVLSARDVVTQLAGECRSLGLAPNGMQVSLCTKLDHAVQNLAAGKTNAACGDLRALLAEVNAQDGVHLTAAQSAELRRAQRALAALGC